MTPIWRGIIAVLIAALIGAIYWVFGPKTPAEIATAPEATVQESTTAAAPSQSAQSAPESEAAPEQADEAVASEDKGDGGEETVAAVAEDDSSTAPETDPPVEPRNDSEDTAEEGASEGDASSDASDSEAAEAEAAEPENTADNTRPSREGDRKSSAEFDIVRVEPGGSTLIAGRTAPGSQIKLMLDGKEAGSAVADATGNFVMFSELGPSVGPRVLTLSETTTDGTELEAEASVILGPILAAEPETAAAPQNVLTTEEADPAADAPAVAIDEPEIAAAPDVQPESPTGGDAPGTEASPDVASVAPAAPTVLIADEAGVRVLQSAGDLPEALTNVSIDSISYDADGEVALAGRSTGASLVRVYLNNSLLVETDIEEGGQWRTALPDVDTGTYTLRVDEVNAAGDVVSRAETPFRRESVAAIRSIEQETELSLAPVSLITVQPGNTLWEIAREKYGEGPLYVRVFDANIDRIRNPDLIYPGQIFTVPD